MKKIIILLSILSIQTLFSQEKAAKEVQDFKKNEIKINALYGILGVFEGTYERSINEESAFGVSVAFILDSNDSDINTAFAISPYYRLYFGKKPVSGFFVEGFSLYQKVNVDNSTYFYDPNTGSGFFTTKEENINAFALGIGLGGKWYTKSNILFELNAGIGRNLSISSNIPNSDYNRITGKIGITVGYRF